MLSPEGLGCAEPPPAASSGLWELVGSQQWQGQATEAVR